MFPPTPTTSRVGLDRVAWHRELGTCERVLRYLAGYFGLEPVCGGRRDDEYLRVPY